jgi:O-antigen ligase/polysaccharide polymerase Wzy-like membrane protein
VRESAIPDRVPSSSSLTIIFEMSNQPHNPDLLYPDSDWWGTLHRLERVAAAVSGVALIYLAATESLEWIPFVAVALLALVVLLIRWPYGALVLLMAAAAVPRYQLSISSWNAKPEHLTAAACGLILLVRIWHGDQNWRKLEKADFLLLSLLVLGFFSSYVASPDRAATLRWSLLLTLATATFFLVSQMVDTREHLEKAMTILLVVGAAEALFGILCFLCYLLFGTELGVSFFFYLDFIPGIHGSQWEPNIFGSYCACFAVMFLFYYLAGGRKGGWYLSGLLVTSVGVLLSLARQGWACLIIVGAMVLLYNQRRTRIQWKRLVPVAVGVLATLLIGVSLMRDLPQRLTTLAIGQVSDDPTVLHRLKYLALAMEDIREHPMVGLGSSSFQLLYQDEDDLGAAPAWLGNLFLRVIHDTGIVGMIVFGWFLIELGRGAWRVLGSSVRSQVSTAVGALSAGGLVMLIAYQLTDASNLAFTWIHFGILAAAVRIAGAGSPAVVGVTQRA